MVGTVRIARVDAVVALGRLTVSLLLLGADGFPAQGNPVALEEVPAVIQGHAACGFLHNDLVGEVLRFVSRVNVGGRSAEQESQK